ncbi:MAG: hypothetical protein ACI9JY_002532, partial [Saprospiraceae bacterium]
KSEHNWLFETFLAFLKGKRASQMGRLFITNFLT